jgi:hypothetical protein
VKTVRRPCLCCGCEENLCGFVYMDRVLVARRTEVCAVSVRCPCDIGLEIAFSAFDLEFPIGIKERVKGRWAVNGDKLRSTNRNYSKRFAKVLEDLVFWSWRDNEDVIPGSTVGRGNLAGRFATELGLTFDSELGCAYTCRSHQINRESF